MLEEIWNIFQVACAGIITIGGAGTIIVGLYKWARKPDDNRDELLKKHDELLDSDNKRLKELEREQAEMKEAQSVLMKSILALMSHAIDGNHLEELKLARDDMKDYLLRR
jgi:hypothetical protein